MGQAKNRGTKELREAEAKKKRLERLDISEKPMEEFSWEKSAKD